MNHKIPSFFVIRYFSLIFLLFTLLPASGQQEVSIPVIRFISPEPSDYNNNSGRILVRAEITSPTTLQTFRIFHNDVVFIKETDLKPERKEKVYIIETLLPLKGGLNTIYIEAGNAAGNGRSEKIEITSQNEPFITWLLPESVNSSTDLTKAVIKAEIKTLLNIKNISINLNGSVLLARQEEISSIGDDVYILEKTVELRPGKNTVFLSAANQRGETKSAARNITYGSSPAVTIVAPAPGDSLNNSGRILVRAEIISYVPLQTFSIFHNEKPFVSDKDIKPEQKDNITYVIETLIPLNRGMNVIFIEAKNSNGTSLSEKRTITSRLEPFITWLVPATATTNIESLEMKIKAEIRSFLPLQKVTVNINNNVSADEMPSTSKLNDDTYIFEKSIQLNSGRNNINISALNTRGETKSVTRVVTFGASPVISIIHPDPDECMNNSGRVLVRAEVVSQTALRTFRIVHNEATFVNEAVLKPEQKDDRTYIIESLVPLSGGQNNIYVEAVNSAGTGRSEKLNVISQNEPFITWIYPQAAFSETEAASIIIKAEIKSAFDLQNITINLNGSLIESAPGELTKVEDGKYIFEHTLKNILAVKNTLVLTAANTRGKTTSAPRNINFLSGAAPVISIAATDSLNNSGIILFNANIVSPTRLLAVRLIQNGSVVVTDKTKNPEQTDSITYSIKNLLPLKAGLNTFYLEVKNSIGTTVSEKLNIFCQPEPIIRWITPSSASSIAASESINIKAEIISTFDLLDAGINLNGQLLTGSKDGLTRLNNDTYVLEKSVPLKSGDNNIFLTASNARGIANSIKRNISFQPAIVAESRPSITPSGTSEATKSTLPVLELPTLQWGNPVPPNTEVNQASLDIRVNIKSAAEIKKVAVYLNGQKMENVSLTDNLTRDGENYLLGSNLVLTPGENTIYITAENNAGSVSSESRSIKYNVPKIPVFAWKNPETSDNTLSDSKILLSADVTSTTPIQGLKVYHNGQARNGTPSMIVKDKQQGVYHLEETITLNQGENSLYFEAVNMAGTSTSDVRKVTFIAAASPVITWTSPSNLKTEINLNSSKIRASIKSPVRLQSLLVYVNGVGTEEINQLPAPDAQGNYTFEKTVSFQPGDNNIYLSATNSVGTTRSEDRILTNPPASKPAISWSIPSDPNTIVNSDIIVIEACIKSSTDLKSAQIFVNGVQWASEMMFQPPLPGDCNYRLTKSVLLKEGDNTIIINATNFAGSEMSERRTIRFQTAIAEKRLALVIGNAEYGSSVVLKNPVNDANLIEGTLRNLGFEVIKRINATKTEMEQAVRDFSRRLSEFNVALFYYAGHGMQVDGENYLIPTDAVMKEQSDCKWEAIRVNFIVEEFEKVPENINIVILDACRNNPFRSWVRGGEQGFRALNAVSGTIVSFATSENSTAADGQGSNGTYTEELVRQMVVPQPISSVFINTRKQVMLRTNNAQRPQEWNMLTGDFYFKK